MENMDMKRAALEELRKKIAKLELEMEMADEVSPEGDMEASVMPESEAEPTMEGEDGEKGVSIEMEMESENPEAAKGMEDLYSRMASEFSAMPASRQAAGSKKSFFGGAPKAMPFGKKARK
jgi:hypothetical protein